MNRLSDSIESSLDRQFNGELTMIGSVHAENGR